MENEDQHQDEAQKKVDVAPEVKTNSGVPDRASFVKMSAQVKPFVKKYGYDDFTQFLNAVGSDGVLASKVINDLLNEKFGIGEQSAPVGISPDSPQENNITGKMDHTGDTPTKLKFEGQTDLPPTSTVTPDAA